MKTAMLKLKLDINQPRLHASGIPQNILFINSIFFGLRKRVSFEPAVCRIKRSLLTMRYKSGFPLESFDLAGAGAAIAGRSSPGILCLLRLLANTPRGY
jgi:hypothetical protein